MPTIWTRQLSPAQMDFLLLCANRPRGMAGMLNNRFQKGVIAPYDREKRTIKALIDRGLIRECWIGQGVPFSGVTLTQAGADTLEPPAKVFYPVDI